MEYLAYSHLVLANTEADSDTEFNLPESKLNFGWKKHFKSSWLTFASVGVLAAILAQAHVASATTYYGYGDRYFASTNGSPLNVRNYPSSDASVVGEYNNGERLSRVIGYRNGFAHLSTGYWVATNWISHTRGSEYTYGPGVGGEINLSYGSSGRLVERLQRRLGVPVTGYYDYTTAHAVRRYQRSVGLYPDGVLGPTTLNSLFQ